MFRLVVTSNLFIYLLNCIFRELGGGVEGGERGRENLKHAPLLSAEPNARLILTPLRRKSRVQNA